MNIGAPELFGLLLFITFPIGFGYGAGKIAQGKGYSFGGFFALGFFTGFIGLIVALVISDKNGGASGLAPCPRCAEPIQRAAAMCRFCGLDLSGSAAAP